MFPPFPQEEAFEYCKQTADQIKNGQYKVMRITQESAERPQTGFMIGSLVCTDPAGEKVVLKTISGIANKLEKTGLCPASDKSIYVDPIVSNDEIHKAYEANDREIHRLTAIIQQGKDTEEGTIKELKNIRTNLCTESLLAIHKLYRFHCADGSVKTIDQIREERGRTQLTQTGTGECCAPKLLNYAFSHNLHPVSMAETYVTLSDLNSQLKGAGSLTLCPPCDSRCGVLLPSMLGIEILYRDEHICVVNKQSGVLSVPGRLPENKDSIVLRFLRLFPYAIEQCAAHRLDQETSGIMVLVYTKDALRNLSRQFELKTVKKEYEALIDGILPKLGIPDEGQNELYFRVDLDNRPHQIWDTVYGKKAVTRWKILRVEKYTAPDGTTRNVTRVLFMPQTGRTHQLRLCAADSHGFGVPIIGDSLYGTRQPGEKLKLHARYIKFQHPVTSEEMEFYSEPQF